MTDKLLGEEVGRLLNRHIAYFMAVVVLLSALDRVNVSFAAKTMNAEMGFDPKTYGFGVGLFFITYMLFQMPGVLVANRKGPGWTLAIMTTLWGLVTVATGFIWNAGSFYAARLLLGVLEGGVAPVMVLYTSRWVPTVAFGRFSSRSALALPASFILGAPISGWLIVNLEGLGGLSGWRWMFVAEGILTVIVGLIAFRLLPERPEDARWLNPAQRAWLNGELARGTSPAPSADGGAARATGARGRFRIDPLVAAWSAVFFALCMGLYGFLFWLPQVIQNIAPGIGTTELLLLSAVPWCFAVIGMFVNGWWSDRTLLRSRHVGYAILLSALGLLIAGLAGNEVLAFTGLIVAGLGIGGSQSLFFSIPADKLRGRPNSGFAFACITLAGGFAGLVGSNLIGLLRSMTGTFTSSILMLSAIYALGAIILLISGRGERGRSAAPASLA